MKTISDNIDKLLGQRNWTYRTFAYQLNVPYMRAYDLIRGYMEDDVPESMYQRVADAFEIGLAELYKGTKRDGNENTKT